MYVPVSTYRSAAPCRLPVRGGRTRLRLPRPSRHGRRLHVAVLHRDAGQHARLRRLRSQRDQPRARGTRTRTRSSPTACACSASATSSTSCRTTWASRPRANVWWRDMLENGPGSPAARFFDVDWTPVKAALQAKLLLPILGDQYGRVLERGELVLAYVDGLLVVRYFEQELPINPTHAPLVLRRAVGPLTAALGADSPPLHEFLSILTSLQNLPSRTATWIPRSWPRRQREKEVARARLARLAADHPEVERQIDEAVREVNGEPGRPESFDALHELLESQSYRLSLLAHGVARDQLPPLLRHQYAGGAAGRRSGGVRRDARAPRAAARRRPRPGRSHRSPGRAVRSGALLRQAPGPRGRRPLRARREDPVARASRCRRGWPVAGTTGYNYLNDLNGVFVNGGEVAPAAPRLRQAHRPHRSVRRRALREQAADHDDGDGERAERARARARAHRRRRPAIARLHARQHAATRSPKSSPVSPSIAPTSTNAAGRQATAPSSSVRSCGRGVATRRWKRRSSTSCAKS